MAAVKSASAPSASFFLAWATPRFSSAWARSLGAVPAAPMSWLQSAIIASGLDAGLKQSRPLGAACAADAARVRLAQPARIVRTRTAALSIDAPHPSACRPPAPNARSAVRIQPSSEVAEEGQGGGEVVVREALA